MRSVRVQDEFSEHRRAVYGWAYRLLRNHHDAMDITQEVFVRWWNAQRGDDPPRSPTGWLRRVTLNLSINLCKARDRRSVAPLGDVAAPIGGTEFDQAEVAGAVAEALSALSDRQRSVLVAKVYDQCTFAQIAEQLELSIPTVKTHYLRALRAARVKLTKTGLIAGETP